MSSSPDTSPDCDRHADAEQLTDGPRKVSKARLRLFHEKRQKYSTYPPSSGALTSSADPSPLSPPSSPSSIYSEQQDTDSPLSKNLSSRHESAHDNGLEVCKIAAASVNRCSHSSAPGYTQGGSRCARLSAALGGISLTYCFLALICLVASLHLWNPRL